MAQPKAWKVTIRLERDGKPKISTDILDSTGDVHRFSDYLTGPETIKDIVQNHLDSASKIQEARKQAGK